MGHSCLAVNSADLPVVSHDQSPLGTTQGWGVGETLITMGSLRL